MLFTRLSKKEEKVVEYRFLRIETTESDRGLDTPAKTAGYSTDFFKPR
jgi:hypothetical protein